MVSTSKNIIAEHDFNSRYVYSLVSEINRIAPSNSVFIALHDDKSERQVNAKSILGLLSAGVKRGDNVTVTVMAGSDTQADECLWSVLSAIQNCGE